MHDATTSPKQIGVIRRYLGGPWRADATAGLTVAVMGVPQAMAYALIAGLPPVYGLYTAIVTCAVAAILGSSNHLVTGPTNALCMVMLSLTAHLVDRYKTLEVFEGVPEPMVLLEIILLLTFMTGVIQLAFGLLRMGGVVRYVSHSVVIGFTAGAGILIALNQLKNIFGIEIAAHAERSYEVFWQTAKNLGATNPYALTIGCLTALIVIVAPKINRKLPAALIGIVVTGSLSYLFGWHIDAEMGASKIDIVKDIPPGVTGGLNIFHVPRLLVAPNYDLTRELATGAVALAFLGLIEAASIARAVASSAGQRVNFTQEFIGQGASNVAGSVFSCFAGSGSFTRTAVCYQSGGQSRMAAVFSAVFTAITLVLLGGVADYIPKPALAGILIVIAYSMIDKQRLMMSWRSGPNARLVLSGTFLSTLVLPLEWAIYVGVFLSLVILLRTTGETDLTQLVRRDDTGFDEVPFNRAAPSPVVTVNMEGDLYFAAAEDLDSELLRCITPETRVVVLRMKRLRAVGSSAMAMLEHFWKLLRGRGISLVVSGIEKDLEDVMTRTGVRKKIGELNIFYADNRLFQSTELALARAWSIANQRARQDKKKPSAEKHDRQHVTAKDVMTTRCIRFGNQHQLREAVWLMSELHKHTRAISPEPLFLQDREGKMFGELSPWRVLDALASQRNGDHSDLDDDGVAELLRRDFTTPIRGIARTDVERHETETSLAKLLETSVEKDQHVIPICDDDGRIKGLVTTDDLLRGLGKALALDKERTDG